MKNMHRIFRVGLLSIMVLTVVWQWPCNGG